MRLYFDIAASRFFTDKATGAEPRVLRIAWWADSEEHPVCRLIQPSTGLTIDPKTLPYHGLDVARLERDGVDAAGVIAELERVAAGARSVVSFHQAFHWHNLHRLMGQVGASIPTTAVCAMKTAEPILAIPAMRPGGGFKSPSLREACAHFGLPAPLTAGEPEEIAFSTLRAVRGVYEACAKRMDR